MADAFVTSAATTEFSPTLTALQAQRKFTDLTSNMLTRVSFDATSMIVGAESLDIPIFPAVDLADETEGTALEYKQFSATKVTLTPGTQKAVVIPITNYARARANQDLMNGYGIQAAADSARRVDIDLAGLYTSATLTVTAGTGADIDEADVLAAKELLDGVSCPPEGRWLGLHHTQYNALLSIDRFTKVDSLGVTAIPTGIVGMLHGFTVMLDQNIVSTTDGFRHNLFGVTSGFTESSIMHGFGTFKAMVSNTLNAGNAPRLIWTFDPKVGSEVIRAELMYGVQATRPEWLGVIKTQDT